jgi:hypothetical protein
VRAATAEEAIMEYVAGTRIKLKGPEGTLDDEYEIVKEIDKNAIKIKDKDGVTALIHKSRAEMPNEAKSQAGQAFPDKGKEKDMVTQATAPAVAEKAEKPSEKKEKKPKVKKAPIPFDMDAWMKENGGAGLVHLQKKSSFDCKDFELTSHVMIDSKSLIYHVLNTYKYPDGTLSLGKKNAGGEKYPLKGKRFNVRFQNKEGHEESKTRIGKKTAEEVEAEYVKKGYTKV